MLLYKYTSYDNAKKIIKGRSLCWSNISTFNDPFEGLFTNESDIRSQARLITLLSSIDNPILQSPEIKLMIKEQSGNPVIDNLGELSSLIERQYIELSKNLTKENFFVIESEMENFIKSSPGTLKFLENSLVMSKTGIAGVAKKTLDEKYGILCLSMNDNNTLMWSHYANNHTGVMFTLDMEHMKIENEKNSIKRHEVIYQEEFPHLDYHTLLGINASMFKEENKDYFEKIALTKSADWAYEKECRLIIKKNNKNNIYNVNPNVFKCVTLGHSMSQKDKEEISSLIRLRMPNIDIHYAKISLDKYEIIYD
ncbi:TPA: DUF2971 domain-containing protein [Serratia liquefaciens]|nr:DUF2971 domain-containing protein [Serratia liquefaciens]